MKPAYLIFIFLLIIVQPIQAQEESGIQEMNKPIGAADLRYNVRFNLGFFISFNAGWGFSIGAGGWIRNNYLQGSSNLTLNWFLGKFSMGNLSSVSSGKGLSNTLFNISYSTLLTVKCGPESMWYYEEINPLYFGSRTGVYNSFKNAVTLGTTFITTPKGSYNNITSPRNRSQQLIFCQFKFGGKENLADNFSFNSIQINLIEDYLGDFVVPFADLRDRFYTGGGSVHLRFGGFFLFKYYTETYTGNSYVDKQDYPDLVIPNEKKWGTRPSLKRKQTYAYQDIGQLGFNMTRNMVSFGLAPGTKAIPWGIDFFIGTIGGNWNAWSQHLIHNLVKVNKNKNLVKSLNDKRIKREKLHHFRYDDRNSWLILGINSQNVIQ